MAAGSCVALFSGGKDSYLALTLAREAGYEVDPLLTVDAAPGSYLFHAPTTALTDEIATALSLPLERIQLSEPGDEATTSETAANREREPLESWLDERLSRDAPPLTGLISGVVESEYQYELLSELCDQRNLELITPLWKWKGSQVLMEILERDLTVEVVAVAAEGLDRSWLGRRLDQAAVEELLELSARYGIHPAGEGGEFETVVLEASDFSRPVRYEAEEVWAGTRGHLVLSDSTAVQSDAEG